MTYVLKNTLAVTCRKNRGGGAQRPMGRSFTRELMVAWTKGSGWI